MTALHPWSFFRSLLRVVALVVVGFMTDASGASSQEIAQQFLDPCFRPGLVVLKKAAGFMEETPDPHGTEWVPNLKLLIGVKAVDGPKQNIYFVELSTIGDIQSNGAVQLAHPVWHTNRFNCPGPEGSSQTNLLLEFTYRLVPLRVRVFDETGRILKQGQAQIPWELMTNSLAHVCRVCLALQAIKATPARNQQQQTQALEELLSGVSAGSINWTNVARERLVSVSNGAEKREETVSLCRVYRWSFQRRRSDVGWNPFHPGSASNQTKSTVYCPSAGNGEGG